MSPVLNLGRDQVKSLSRLLSRYLSRTTRGQAIIQEFKKDPQAGNEAISRYIQEQLRDQPDFQHQVKDALGEDVGEHFLTLVGSGARVDQIINVGSVGQLSIRYSIFDDTQQVIVFLLGLVVIGAVIGAGVWWYLQPKRMTGSFNIFVAEFSQSGDSRQNVAGIVSQRIFNYLEGQRTGITFETVQVAHNKFPQIRNAEGARDLAEKINAQVVIYGDVATLHGQVRLTPQFYIAEDFRSNVGELNGQQKLAMPVTFPVESVMSDDALQQFEERTYVLTEFTKALVYLAVNDLDLADQAAKNAIENSQAENFDGKEVLFLFMSQIARLDKRYEDAQRNAEQALAINPKYGRGYIALANIYYDQRDFPNARENYNKAKALPDQPFGAYIHQKASLGIGNICSAQFRSIHQTESPDQAALDYFEKCASDAFNSVIEFYNQRQKPEKILKEMAAQAYYELGIIDQAKTEFQQAQEMYRQTLLLTANEDLIKRAQTHLQEVKQ